MNTQDVKDQKTNRIDTRDTGPLSWSVHVTKVFKQQWKMNREQDYPWFGWDYFVSATLGSSLDSLKEEVKKI